MSLEYHSSFAPPYRFMSIGLGREILLGWGFHYYISQVLGVEKSFSSDELRNRGTPQSWESHSCFIIAFVVHLGSRNVHLGLLSVRFVGWGRELLKSGAPGCG